MLLPERGREHPKQIQRAQTRCSRLTSARSQSNEGPVHLTVRSPVHPKPIQPNPNSLPQTVLQPSRLPGQARVPSQNTALAQDRVYTRWVFPESTQVSCCYVVLYAGNRSAVCGAQSQVHSRATRHLYIQVDHFTTVALVQAASSLANRTSVTRQLTQINARSEPVILRVWIEVVFVRHQA